AAAGDDLNGLRQCAVVVLQLSQRSFSVVAIDIDDEETVRMASSSANVVVGVFRPPSRYCGVVGRRVLEAMSCRRGFPARGARKHSNALVGERQCGAVKTAHFSCSKTLREARRCYSVRTKRSRERSWVSSADRPTDSGRTLLRAATAPGNRLTTEFEARTFP